VVQTSRLHIPSVAQKLFAAAKASDMQARTPAPRSFVDEESAPHSNAAPGPFPIRLGARAWRARAPALHAPRARQRSGVRSTCCRSRPARLLAAAGMPALAVVSHPTPSPIASPHRPPIAHSIQSTHTLFIQLVHPPHLVPTSPTPIPPVHHGVSRSWGRHHPDPDPQKKTRNQRQSSRKRAPLPQI
jgi:hypothetical protein